MSLKIFHLSFITLSILTFIGLSFWAFTQEATSMINTIIGTVSIISVLCLLVYGYYFIKKLRKSAL